MTSTFIRSSARTKPCRAYYEKKHDRAWKKLVALFDARDAQDAVGEDSSATEREIAKVTAYTRWANLMIPVATRMEDAAKAKGGAS